jgi:hypothetical protein
METPLIYIVETYDFHEYQGLDSAYISKQDALNRKKRIEAANNGLSATVIALILK